MYSFNRVEGWYAGRPVAAGSTPSKPNSAESSASTNASITRTGLLSSMKSSRHSGNNVVCPRSAPAMKRFIDPLENHQEKHSSGAFSPPNDNVSEREPPSLVGGARRGSVNRNLDV